MKHVLQIVISHNLKKCKVVSYTIVIPSYSLTVISQMYLWENVTTEIKNLPAEVNHFPAYYLSNTVNVDKVCNADCVNYAQKKHKRSKKPHRNL